MSALRSLDVRYGPGRRALLTGAALASAVAIWAGVLIAWFTQAITLPASHSKVDILIVGVPLVLGLAWARRPQTASVALRYAAGVSGVLATILLLSPEVISHRTLAIALPALVVLTWIVWHKPALGTVVVLGITASFGSLHIYLNFPYYRTITAVMAALVVASLLRLLFARPRGTLWLPVSVLVILGYLVVTVAQYLLSSSHATALAGIELAPWTMLVMVCVAYSQWSDRTHVRIVRGLAAIAAAAGAYAVLRLIIGPSAAEARNAGDGGPLSAYNFVNGHLKLLGSFPNGIDLAHWTGLMLPLCVSLAIGLRGPWRRVAIVSVPLLAVALIGAQSRASGLGAAAASIVVVLLYVAARAFPGPRLEYAVTTLVALVVVGSIAVGTAGGASSQSGSGHSYSSLLSGPSHDLSYSQHEYKLKQAIHDLQGHPFGYGLGTANPGFNPPSVTPVPSGVITPISGFVVDNGFFKVALEQGLMVMILFVAGLIALVGTLSRGAVRERDPLRAPIVIGSVGVLISLLAMEMGAAVADGIPATAAWIVLGLGLAQCVRRPAPAAQARAS